MAIDPEVADAINLMWIFVAGIFCFILQAGEFFVLCLLRKFVAAGPCKESSQSTCLLPNAIVSRVKVRLWKSFRIMHRFSIDSVLLLR
jgi:hypothetical protein